MLRRGYLFSKWSQDSSAMLLVRSRHAMPRHGLESQSAASWRWQGRGSGREEWSWTEGEGEKLGVGRREAGIGREESGTSVHTGRPRKGALWSQGRLWLLSEGRCGPRSRHWRCSQRAGSKREFRKTRGFFRSEGGKRRGGKLGGKVVRGLVMAMALEAGAPRARGCSLWCASNQQPLHAHTGWTISPQEEPARRWVDPASIQSECRAAPFHFLPQWEGSRSVLSRMAAANHVRLMSTWNMTSLTEILLWNRLFHLNSFKWLHVPSGHWTARTQGRWFSKCGLRRAAWSAGNAHSQAPPQPRGCSNSAGGGPARLWLILLLGGHWSRDTQNFRAR